MTTQIISSVLPRTQNLAPFFPRSLSTVSFRHLSPAAVPSRGLYLSAFPSFCSVSTNAIIPSPDDHSLTNRLPPEGFNLPPGMDFKHWLIVMVKPEDDASRDDIINSYIKTLAQVVGSEEEARMKIYSVSTRHYFAFGALVSEDLADKIRELPRVWGVLPDSYLDQEKKDYGGEPFINGQAVPYDPKYHEEWVRNNALNNVHPGSDFKHWLVLMEKPEDGTSRDDIIDSYIKTLAQVVGSEEEARMKIYSVSTRRYFAFGANVSQELADKIKELPRVWSVVPESYLDKEKKDYGCEPFINGQAV